MLCTRPKGKVYYTHFFSTQHNKTAAKVRLFFGFLPIVWFIFGVFAFFFTAQPSALLISINNALGIDRIAYH